MWILTLDFMKAFDSRSHQSLWKSLEKCGLESHYMCLVRRFYGEQKRSVSTDKECDVFEMKTGTKQDDPQSSFLIDKLLQMELEDDVESWQQ